MQKLYWFILICCIWVPGSQAMNTPKMQRFGKKPNVQLAQELIAAVPMEKEAMITAMLLEQADPNLCIEGRNALHEAARFGRKSIVRLLLEHGAQIEVGAPGYLNATALCFAVYNGYADVVEELIASKANVNHSIDTIKATPLHIAAMKGRLRIAQLLIGAGANLNARNKDNCTPLHSVAECGKLEYIQFINVNPKESKRASDKKILDSVSQNVYVALADLFLRNGANIEHNPIKGTPLHLAARHCQPELVQLLIRRGANLFAQRPISATPLHEAIVGFATESIKQPGKVPEALSLIQAFICTPSKKIEQIAKEAVFPALCCFARLSKGDGIGGAISPEKRRAVFARDMRKLLWRYCLVPFLVDEQLKELRKLFEVRMKFGPVDWTPSELATARAGNSKNPDLMALAALINPAYVEQHRVTIQNYLYKILKN